MGWFSIQVPHFWTGRHSEVKGGTLAGLALHINRAVMHFDNPFRNRQTQPGSAVLTGTRLVGPPEAVEDVDHILLRDSDARVRDRRYGEPFPRLTAYRYLSSSRRVLGGIIDQNQKRPPKRVRVRLNPDRIFRHVRRKVQAARSYELLTLIASAAHDLTHIDRARFDCFLARIGASKQHEAIDDLGGSLSLFEDFIEGLQILARGPIPLLYRYLSR